MGDEVKEVRIVEQRLSVEDSLCMFDTMLGAFEVLLGDPVRLLRITKIVAMAERLREQLPDDLT